MRIVLVGLVIVLLVMACSLAFRYNQDASYARNELNEERYKRMNSEESLQKANREISSLHTELKRVNSKIESTEMVLERTKAINTDLKDRLDRAAKIHQTLEKRVSELQQMVNPL